MKGDYGPNICGIQFDMSVKDLRDTCNLFGYNFECVDVDDDIKECFFNDLTDNHRIVDFGFFNNNLSGFIISDWKTLFNLHTDNFDDFVDFFCRNYMSKWKMNFKNREKKKKLTKYFRNKWFISFDKENENVMVSRCFK